MKVVIKISFGLFISWYSIDNHRAKLLFIGFGLIWQNSLMGILSGAHFRSSGCSKTSGGGVTGTMKMASQVRISARISLFVG
jgi:hypothetical protein